MHVRGPINAGSLSLPHPRPPWHGRGQGFESPKLHGKSASQSTFDLEKRVIVLMRPRGIRG